MRSKIPLLVPIRTTEGINYRILGKKGMESIAGSIQAGELWEGMPFIIKARGYVNPIHSCWTIVERGSIAKRRFPCL
jgi:hypothetical protein